VYNPVLIIARDMWGGGGENRRLGGRGAQAGWKHVYDLAEHRREVAQPQPDQRYQDLYSLVGREVYPPQALNPTSGTKSLDIDRAVDSIVLTFALVLCAKRFC
jgi:hypothetical protein